MIELIPAIDIIDGKAVRLSQGDYRKKTIYSAHPAELAKEWEDIGIKRIHLVDLEGAKSKHIVNYKTLEKIATQTNLVIDFGGGIKSEKDLSIAFDNGASMVTVGSIAATAPDLFSAWLHQYGSDKIILGADVKEETIAIHGWKEESNLALFPFLEKNIADGVQQIICTDIEQDGMLQGPSIALYKKIMKHYPTCHLIASGGVSKIEDIYALETAGIPAVIVGKAIYEERISLKELKQLINSSL